MVEDLIYRNIMKKIIVGLLSTKNIFNDFNDYNFDEDLFCLLLLDIEDKGFQRVKKTLLRDYTQENLNQQFEKDFDFLGQRVLKRNLKEEDKLYFQHTVRVINFLKEEVVKKASERSSYIESLRIKINCLERNDIYNYMQYSNIFPTKEEYFNLINQLKEKDEITVAKEIFDNKEIASEFNLDELDFKNRVNKNFFDKISNDIKELKFLENDKEGRVKNKDLIEQKKQKIKLMLQIGVIDYDVKMKDVIAKNNIWELEKDLTRER